MREKVKYVVRPKMLMLSSAETVAMSSREIEDHYKAHEPPFDSDPDAVVGYYRNVATHNLALFFEQKQKTTKAYELAGFIGLWLVFMTTLLILYTNGVIGQ